MELTLQQQQDWNKSLGKSIAMHLLLLLLALFFKLSSDPTQNIETQYAVTVSFQEVEFTSSKSSNSTKSTSSEGAQRSKSETPKKIESPKPAAIPVPTPPKAQPTPKPTPPVVTQQPTEPVISETTQEESDIQAVEEPIEVEAPEPEYIPQESPDPQPTEEVIISEPDLPTLDDIIGDINDDPIESEEEPGSPSDKPGTGSETSKGGGTGDSDPSLKDGPGGSGKGDSGSGKGKDADGDDGDSGKGTGGYGEGEFDASGDGIFGRKVIFNNYADLKKVYVKSGKIWIKTCVNRKGDVSYVEIDEVNSTIKDYKILRDALNAVRGYKFEADYTAAKEQCGVIKINLDLTDLKKFGK